MVNRLGASALLLGLLSLSATPALADNFSLSPRATFLLSDSGDSAVNPAIVDLSALTTPVHAGDTITITRLGAFKFAINDNAETGTGMAAVFSSTNTILSNTNLNRVPGAIDAGTDYTSPLTFAGSLPTNISQDFLVDDAQAGQNRHFASVTLQVPAGANFLFVGVVDSLYSDNVDTNADFGFSITAVPEPASLMMLGLGSLALVRQRKLDF